MMTSEKTFIPVVKRRNIDSGYAWIVLVVAYLGLLIHTVTVYMNGVIYLALLQHFGESITKTSLVVTLSSSTLCFGSPIAGFLTNKYSCRVTLMIGGLLTTLGYAASAFVPNINGQIVTNGIFVGTGQGFIVSGCLCVTGFYFDRYRNISLSLCYIIPGAGLFISTPLAISVLENFGLSGLFLVCASLLAHTCLIGVLSRPSEIELELQKQRTSKGNSVTTDGLLKNAGGLDLLKHKSFLCYLFTNIAWGFSLITCTTHIPNFISVSNGSDADIESVMMILAISNTLGRATGVLVINCYDKCSLCLYTTSFLLSAILTVIFPIYSTSAFGIYGFAVQAAYCAGIPNSMLTHLPRKFVGIARLPEANGLSLFFFGIGFGSGPFVTGFVYEKTQSYEYSFVVAGVVLLFGTICGFAVQWFERRNDQQKHGVRMGITLEIKE